MSIQRKAYAKINLALDVTGRLPNGYHEVRMIMQTVDLYDTLTFEKYTPGPGEDPIRIRTDSGELSNGPDNLIYRAAQSILSAAGVREGVQITLQKRIPIAAGMAGGSTDAAATFHGLNELFGLGFDERKLCELGVKIGADVPYCIIGGTALAEGIGERLTKLPDAPRLPLVIAKPEVGVSTKYVYEHLDDVAGWTHAADHTLTDTAGALQHPDVDGMRSAIEAGDAEGVIARLGNVLEQVTIPGYPVVGQIKEHLAAAGARGVLMSGSGPTVFAVFGSAGEAEKAAEDLKKTGLAKETIVSCIR